MSKYDTIFVENLKRILGSEGTEYESRAVWKDTGKKAMCRKIFGVVNEYNADLSNTPPVGTIRKFPIKTCIDELLWIWQKKSNNIKDLNSHVWDDWADDNGSIGAAYGFQVRSKLRKVSHDIISVDFNHVGATQITDHFEFFVDQTDFVLHELKYNWFSRRILTTLYAIDENQLMGLDPCCYSCTWNVTEKNGFPYLNLLLNQRSQDMIAANNWNVFQYWILQNLFARCTGLLVGKLTHVIADCHIYDRHIEIAEKMIDAADQAFPDPQLIIHNDSMDFYDYKVSDFELVDYKYLMDIKNIPVAV